jgi:Arc/MetJ-type ribon-helix-helix transcriptional regulator
MSQSVQKVVHGGRTPDRRFSVCIDADVANKLDEQVAQRTKANRSQAVEEALRLWESLSSYPDRQQVFQAAMKLYEEQQERELYRAYYAELGEQAQAEDAAWTQVAEETAARRWSVGEHLNGMESE